MGYLSISETAGILRFLCTIVTQRCISVKQKQQKSSSSVGNKDTLIMSIARLFWAERMTIVPQITTLSNHDEQTIISKCAAWTFKGICSRIEQHTVPLLWAENRNPMLQRIRDHRKWRDEDFFILVFPFQFFSTI